MDRRDIFPRSLQYLIAIAEYGSYTRAAEALHVSQPTLSQQIKQLEDYLQSPLLDRSGRSVQLTDAGKIFLQHARRAWGELNIGTRAIQDVQDLSRGSLRLGWTPITDYLTCSLLARYHHLYPGITLSTLDMPQDDIEPAISEARIDIGIAFSKPSDSEEASSNTETFTLFEEALYLAVGDAHPRAKRKKHLNAQDFGKESLVQLNTDFALRHHIDRYCHDYGIEPRNVIETNSLTVIIEMVELGSLATVLPSTIINTQRGLHPIEVVPELPHHTVSMIWHKSGYKSPACLAFLELASEWSSAMLQTKSMQ
ncbi:MAG: transcriptional regulator CynR [Gammaproteobacteria bacterium]|nr:transcriptional regulator CynR [Gammaproteobacteria bacterium]